MDVYRQKPIPVIFAELPFIRVSSPSYFVDSLEDLSTLRELQSVASGKQCVSILEDHHVLLMKCALPDDLLQRNGSTHDLLNRHCFSWKMWDIETIFTGLEPAEAVPLSEAGIDTSYLQSIVNKSSCIPLLQKTAVLFGNKGYKFKNDLKKDILEIEERLFAGLDIGLLKGSSTTSKHLWGKSKSAPVVPPKLRMKILRRDKYRCIICGRGSQDTELEVDHVIPKNMILNLDLDQRLLDWEANLRTTCFDDNRGKGGHLAKEDIEFYVNSFSDPDHPNHGIVKYLEAVGKIQEISING